MRYPKHLILDLQTPSTSPLSSNWDGEFARATNLKLNSELGNLIVRESTFALNPFLQASQNTSPSSTLTATIFDIHFLRKEKLYTKLKYSRCPQYDIVSGGFAAILAGFIGFLISEKFGIELVDSADFYNALMYGVFAAFSIRPLLRVYSKDETPYSPISLKYLLLFVHDLLILFLNYTSASFKKLFSFLFTR